METGTRPYEERAQQVFSALAEGCLIPKGLARSMPQFARVPRFVAEFLLARQLRRGEGAAEVADYLAAHLPSPPERNLWTHELVTRGSLEAVDLVEIVVDEKTGAHTARLDSLGLKALASPKLAERHPGLMTGGLWGHVDLRWDEETKTRLEQFIPVQATVRIDLVLEARHYFDETGDWVDLLLASAGYDPLAVEVKAPEGAPLRRLKLLYLARLAPLVEPNLNLIELGPKNTGKTFLLRSLSPRVHVVSGGRVSPAALFVNLATRRPGLLAERKAVVFDEVARLSLGAAEGVATLKDYLESGTFGRGAQSLRSDCSLFFTGNIEIEGAMPSPRYRHLFEPLPREFRDSAFADRLHGFIPGWELPKLSPSSFATGVGFVSDFFGEVLYRLRNHPYEREREEAVSRHPLLKGATQRDAVALERLSRALLKMVFPLGAPPDDPWLSSILAVAGELRQLVHDQLCQMAPGEFAPRQIGFDLGQENRTVGMVPPPSPVPVSPRSGEVFYLDLIPLDEGHEIRLRKVEAALIPSGKGLRLASALGTQAKRSIQLVFDYIEAHPDLLGLPAGWFRERSIAVDVPGEAPGDGAGLGLAAFLAMSHAALHQAPQMPVVALGIPALHGELAAPQHLYDRLHSLPPGPGLLLIPQSVPIEEGLVPKGWRISPARSLGEALALTLGEG